MKSLLYRKVIKKVRRAGFALRRTTSGSHEVWWNDQTHKTCVIPHHREVSPGTLKSIINQMEITEKEFLDL